MEKLNFQSREEAQAVRDEYFKRYHSTAKVCTQFANRLSPDSLSLSRE
jgi:hypothetical protein